MIVALVGQKGGSGKSTLAITIAAELAARRRAVLLVDADPQRTAVTWHDVAAEGGRETPTVIAMTGTLHQPNQLPKLVAGYRDIVIDTPPRLGEVQRSAMMVADLALLPCGPSSPDAWALAGSVETIQQALDYRPQLKGAIVITKKRSGTVAAKTVREALSTAGLSVLRSEISLRQAYHEALAAGMGVREYAPRDRAAAEVKALVTEILAMGGGK